MNASVRPLEHPRVRRVALSIFTTRFAPDCMTHACRFVPGGAVRLDVCCSYGADLTLAERDAILSRAPAIVPLLAHERRDPATWFDAALPEPDAEGATWIRTAVAGSAEDSGCVFLAAEGRGCALHRASAGSGAGTLKPAVCRLFPLEFGDGLLTLSGDIRDYSCHQDKSGPTVYRLMRATLAAMFGTDLIVRLDALEGEVLARTRPAAA